MNPILTKHLSFTLSWWQEFFFSLFFYKSWQDKGIFYIRDFMDSNGNFLNLHTFSQSTTINRNVSKYQGVIECLRKFIKKKDNEGNTKMNMIGPILPKAISSILKQKKRL